jgi:hypothetical protein
MFFAYTVSLGVLGEPMGQELPCDSLLAQFVDSFVAGTEAQA